MALNVIMMGPPGAGKGTQASRFARERGLLKISTGDILRDAIKEGNPVALAAKSKMDRGELVDDATMVEIVRHRLTQPDAMSGFVLDGFPRTVFQARALDVIVEDRRNGPLVIIDVSVPEEELVRRLAIRRICSNCGTGADCRSVRRFGYLHEVRRRTGAAGGRRSAGRSRAPQGVRTGDASGARLLSDAAYLPAGERRPGAGDSRT
jgi:adenylate kinase family enzyme